MKFGCWRGEIYESLSNRLYVLDIKGYCRNSITVNRLDESVLSIKFRSLIDSGAAHVWEIPYTIWYVVARAIWTQERFLITFCEMVPLRTNLVLKCLHFHICRSELALICNATGAIKSDVTVSINNVAHCSARPMFWPFMEKEHCDDSSDWILVLWFCGAIYF